MCSLMVVAGPGCIGVPADRRRVRQIEIPPRNSRSQVERTKTPSPTDWRTSSRNGDCDGEAWSRHDIEVSAPLPASCTPSGTEQLLPLYQPTDKSPSHSHYSWEDKHHDDTDACLSSAALEQMFSSLNGKVSNLDRKLSGITLVAQPSTPSDDKTAKSLRRDSRRHGGVWDLSTGLDRY